MGGKQLRERVKGKTAWSSMATPCIFIATVRCAKGARALTGQKGPPSIPGKPTANVRLRPRQRAGKFHGTGGAALPPAIRNQVEGKTGNDKTYVK